MMKRGRGQGSHDASLVDGTSDIEIRGDWRNAVMLQDAIALGRKVRETKPKKSIPIPGGSEIMKIDFVAPPCMKPRKNKRKRESSPNVKIVSKKPKKGLKKKHTTQCSVRVAELAVPSKRACAENWKRNHHILPTFMIERLKNVVTDQAPMVQIADAYGSFKKRKLPKSQRPKAKETYKKSSAEDRAVKKKLKNECLSEKHYLCALFGHKINKKLMRPLDVKQCNKLGYLYDIVAQEIDLLMQPVKVNTSEKEEYFKFREEISKTVAIWIRLVMRDTCDKVLEDQLRELEEEEGPVLDFLDVLLANVLSKCAPGISQMSEDGELMSDAETLDTVTINTEEFCAQEINKVLGNIIEEDDVHLLNNTSEHFELFDDEHQIPTTDSNAGDFADATDPNDIDYFEDAQSLQQSNYEERNENVSQIRLTSRDGVDNENMSTQIQFSNNVNRRDFVKTSSNISLSNLANKKAQYLSWASDTTLPRPVTSAPNAELLREVNERWPENLNTVVKTASIIKSVSSLGNIGEIDELTSTFQDPLGETEKSTDKDLQNVHAVDKSLTSKSSDIKVETKIDFEKKSSLDVSDELFASKGHKKVRTENDIDGKSSVDVADKPELPNHSDKKGKTAIDIDKNYVEVPNESARSQSHYKKGRTAGDVADNKHTSDVGILFKFEFDKKDKSINTISKRHDNSAIQTKDPLSGNAYDVPSDGGIDRKSILRKDATLDRKTSVTNLHGYLDKKLSVTDLCHGYLSQNGINASRHTGYGDLNTEDGSESNEEVTREYFFETDEGVEPKINLKVDMKSAPLWLKWYEEECKKGMVSQKLARRWCEDLQFTIEGLDEVNNWIQKTSESILRLKHRKELKRCCPSKCKQRIKDVVELEKIYYTSAYYEKTNKHLNNLLVNHRSKYVRNKKPSENWTCNCRKFLANLKK